MNARQALVCPACGVRNRPTWEFCAKCGESLEGATLATEGEEDAVEVEASPEAVTGVPSTVVLGVSLLALVAFAAVAFRQASQAEPPPAPDPAMFTIATLPAEQRDSPPLPATPGAAEYREGQRLALAGDHEGARDSFAAAVAADGSNASYRSAYGRALWRVGGRQQALQELSVAAGLDPERQLAYARALDIAGERQEAVHQYEAVLARTPDAAVVHEDLGRLHYRSGDYEPAALHLERAVAARPDDPVLRQELGYALDAAGNKEGAERVYRDVLVAAPEAAISRGLLAENLYEQGRQDEALAILEEGVTVSPDAPLLQRQLGSILERSGRQTEAAEAYRRYAELAPNAPDAREIAERAARLDKAGGTK